VARASAKIEDLKAGRLPPICAKTGEPADGSIPIEFTSTPAWTLILLLFGIIPFFIARAFSTVRVVGLVPMSDVAQRRKRAFDRASVGLLLLSVTVLAIGVATHRAVVLTGVAMVIATALFVFFGVPFVLPSGEVSGDWVRLSFVDRRFANALDDWYGTPDRASLVRSSVATKGTLSALSRSP
jgi:hypothetical protein